MTKDAPGRVKTPLAIDVDGISQPEKHAPDVRMGQHGRGAVEQADLAEFEHHAIVAAFQRLRCSARPSARKALRDQLPDGIEDHAHRLRRQTQRRFVEQRAARRLVSSTMAISMICCSPPLLLPASVVQRCLRRGKRVVMASSSALRSAYRVAV